MSKPPPPPPPQTTLDLSTYPVGQNGQGYSVQLSSGSKGFDQPSYFHTGVLVGASPTGAGIDAPITVTGAAQIGAIPLSVTTVIGSGGSDVITGADRTNTALTLNGGGGNDYIEGNSGTDTLIGGTGNDVLIAGWGNNTMTGGVAGATTSSPSTGDDIFVFLGNYPAGHVTNTDIVTDYNGQYDSLTFLDKSGVPQAPTSWQPVVVNGVASLEGVAYGGGTIVVLEGVTDATTIHVVNFDPTTGAASTQLAANTHDASSLHLV